MILLVEDNPGDALLLETALSDAGAAVALRVVATAGQALDLLRDPRAAGEVELVVVDLRLPGQDGWAVLEALAGDARFPVAVLTSSTRDDDRARAESYGVRRYLVKPTSIDGNRALVQALLELGASRP